MDGFRPRRSCFRPRSSADVGMSFWIILIEVIEFRHQLPAADGAICRVKRHGHVPWAGISRTCAAGIKDGMRNCVLKHQSAKRMAQQHAMMNLSYPARERPMRVH